ncbi:MAG TPA: hypothetical protein VKB50_16720 [Vicinamibacterales bacterium]|nr:hypothetical protein [Vicinamibacterales bacterium]
MNRTLISPALRCLSYAGLMTLVSIRAVAQPPAPPTAPAQPHEYATGDSILATPIGHEVNVSFGGYRYNEPGTQSISIHGSKIGGGYTGTLSLNERRRWFTQADARGTVGNTTYDGWCSPFLITPDTASPNGWALDIGDASPCSEAGDKDWYVEARGLVGKDFIGRTWGVSPEAGLGVRHLSNGIGGAAGYRTDDYLYLPLGLTARTRAASHSLGFNVEYDRLLHGWQTTRDSDLGGGDIPPTATAPGFTIDGFTDISFAQHEGWGLRASGKYQVTRHWSVEPSYVHWSINSSPVNYETATFTVHGVTAEQQLGAYEPVNTTNEFVVKLGFRF